MSAAMLYTLIFGVAYPLCAITVWTVCAFGISATLPETRANAHAFAMNKWAKPYGGSLTYVAECEEMRVRVRVVSYALLSFLAGALWPVGIPLWLGWRKGSFIANALEKRDEMDDAARKAVAA